TDPFGNPRGTQPAPGTWAGDKGFVGGTKDDTTGLTNLGARQYQPTTGRFLNPDPLLGTGNPQQWNGYAYSNNDPIGSSDPSGLYTCRNGHEGCNEHGNACSSSECKDVNATMVGDCIHSECSHSTVNQNPYHTISEQRDARATKILKDIQNAYEYANKKVCNNNMKVAQCHTQKEWDDGDKAFNKAVIDSTLIIPAYKCTSGGGFGGKNQEDCDTLGVAISTMDLGPLASEMAAAGDAESTAMRDLLRELSAVCKRSDSFPGETPVLLAGGETAPIQDIKVGDTVTATDPLTGQNRPETVTAVIKTLTDVDFTDLTITTAHGDQTLTSTQHHPYWDATTQTWTSATSLHVGDNLRQLDGTSATVTAIHNYTRHITTYNLTISQYHTYYVLTGNTPVLVHNSTPGIPCGGQLLGTHPGGWDPGGIPSTAIPDIQEIEQYGVRTSGRADGVMGPDIPEAFENSGKGGGYALPRTASDGSPITYREWGMAPTPGNPKPGGERIVTGSDGSIYYSPTHYQTFYQYR
ncbi:RHS repeat-associated core domain-containing protein, partial [Kitasatospora sp. MBT63]|uniref:RHS repeat-associated core domain-containing protein n=1 Tax=Kitasatospora sp. MBT63 TaxID=1444768 RepID=UPI00053B2A98